MAEQSQEALILINDESRGWENIFYLSGFKGSSAILFVTADSAVLTVDSRYITQARQQCCFEVHVTREGLSGTVSTIVKGLRRLAFDAEALSAKNYLALCADKRELFDFSSELAFLRRKKDEWEIACIKRASQIASEAYQETLNYVRAGMTEIEFAKLLELAVCRRGGEGIWHNSSMIVASGVRSAMPHGTATTKAIETGDQVTVDYGAIYCGYMSDITRNFSLGSPREGIFNEIHNVLLTAHNESSALLKPGVRTSDVHKAAQMIIDDAGYGTHFGHALGHSFGLEIHERPVLSPRSKEVLKEGDVVTIEPGIYLPGRGGLRLEDDYLITKNGSERLTRMLPQNFICL